MKLAEEFVLPQITPDVRRRQVSVQQMALGYDLNASTLDCALAMLGGLEPHTTAFLVVADGNRNTAEKLGEDFRLAVIVLPPEVMHNFCCWALVSAKGTVFSVPTV